MSNTPFNAGPRAHDPHRLLQDLAWVQRLAFRLCSDATLAEDLRQDAAVAALGRTVPAEGPTRRWLAGVVRKSLLMRGRSGARRSAREAAVAVPESMASGGDVVERAETQAAVTEAVIGLREPYRTAIPQRYFDEWTPSEMAERTATSLDTVKSRLKRGLVLLEAELGGRFGEGRDDPEGGWLAALLPLAAMESNRRALLAAASGGTGGAAPTFLPWLPTSLIPMFTKLIAVSLLLLGAVVLFTDRDRAVEDGGSPAPETGPQVTVVTGVVDEVDPRGSGGAAAKVVPADAVTVDPDPVGAGQEIPEVEPAVEPAVVTGTVIDDRGRPLSAARISVFEGTEARWDAAEGDPVAMVLSDEAGRFRLEVAPDSPSKRWVGVEAGRYQTALRMGLGERSYLSRLPLVPGENRLGTVVLGRAGAVSGKVLDAAGLPVGGATVEVLGDATMLTGADGRFDLVGLLPGQADVRVYQDGCLLEERGVVIPSGKTVDGLEFRLEPAPVLEGQVLDAGGKPVAGAQVELESADDILVRTATSDASGAFRVSFSDLGEAELRVRADGFELWDSFDHDVEFSPGSESVRVELRRGDDEVEGDLGAQAPAAFHGAIEGRIVRGGEPLSGAFLQVVRGVKTSKAMRRLRPDVDEFLGVDWLPSLVRVARDGSFRVEGLERGLYRIVVLSSTTGAHEVPVFELNDDELERLGDVEVPDAGTVRGQVILPPGVSPLGLEVSCGSGLGKVRGVLDDGGRFELQNVPVGTQTVELESRDGEIDDSGEVSVRVTSGAVVDTELDASDLGLVEVRLELDLGGVPPDDYRIMLVPVDGPSTPVLFERSDAEGRLFAFVQPAGEVRVFLVDENLEQLMHPTARLHLIAGQAVDRTLAFDFGELRLNLGSGRTIPDAGLLVVQLRRTDVDGQTSLEIEFEEGEPIDLEESAGLWLQPVAGTFELRLNRIPVGAWKVTATMEDLDEEGTIEDLGKLTGEVWIKDLPVTVSPR